jgi:hypothetical protein
MAKDNREIVHGIRVTAPIEGRRLPQSKTFASGMEDELAAQFTQPELDAMKERGDITGNWKSLKKTEGTTASTGKESAKGSAK